MNEPKFKGVALNMQLDLEEYRQKIGAMSEPELRKVRWPPSACRKRASTYSLTRNGFCNWRNAVLSGCEDILGLPRNHHAIVTRSALGRTDWFS
jgi:hypothetical protein